MAIPFLNNVNLSDNQLLNAKAHITPTAPTAAKGQFYLDSSDNILKYHNGSAWVSLVASTGGTVTNVSSATTGQLTVANGTTTPSLSIVTGAVSSGGSALATGGQIYSFVTGQNYLTGITISGDMDGSGTSTISLTANAALITGKTALTSGLTSTDEFLVSDGGSLKKMDVSVLQSYMQSNLTFTTDIDTTYDLSNSSVSGGSRISLTGSDASVDTVDVLGTTNEVEVTHGAGQIQVGLPNDVTIGNNLTVSGDLNVIGVVNSTTTNELKVDEQYITLNGGQTTPTLDGFLKVERGATDVALKWNEGTDRWQFTNDGSTYYNMPISSEYNNYVHPTQSGISLDGGGLSFVSDITVNTLGHVTAASLSTIQSASTSQLGVVELATSAEVITGTDTTRAVTPATLSARSYATTIADTATVTHGLGSRDVIVQLFDTVTYETVYADVERSTTAAVDITFSTTPSNSIRVLITKIV